MFITKFIVPVTREFHNNVSRFSLRKPRRNNKVLSEKSQNSKRIITPSKCEEYGEKLASCRKPSHGLLCCKKVFSKSIPEVKNACMKFNLKSQSAKRLITPSKCKEYAEKLALCPKPTHELLCCKKLFSKSMPEAKNCKVKLVVEHYEKVYEDITVYAKSILKSVQEESKSILGRFKNDIQVAKTTDEVQLQEFSRKIIKRLEEILTLDPQSGSLKRKYALSLNYEIRHAFNNLQYDIVPKAKRVEEILGILERDVLICIDRARSLILFCRKCKDPQALTKCIEENADYAKQILDDAFKNAQISLRKVEALKQETLQCHKTAVAEMIEIYCKKHKVFLEHLEKCIVTIRNINKQ